MLLTQWFFLIIITILLIFLLTHCINKLHLYRAAGQFSGPRALPLIGNAFFVIGNTADFANFSIKLVNKYRTPFRFWLGTQLFIGISDPEDLKAVLMSPKTIDKADVYRVLHSMMGIGLITAPVAKWRAHRKLIQPTFNTRILESFIDIFIQQSNTLTKELEVEVEKDEFIIHEYVARSTLNIICESVMSASNVSQSIDKSHFLESIPKMEAIASRRTFNIWLQSDIIFRFTSYFSEQKECLKHIHKYTDDIIQLKHRQLRDSQNFDYDKSKINEKSTKKTFMDFLIELATGEQQITDEELRDEVMTMIIAGSETSATLNTFILFMLANFPEIQQKCYDELCEIFGDNINTDTLITSNDLGRMNYLERVMKETMRLFPIVPILARKVLADLNVGKYTFPKDSSILIPIMYLHRRPDLWENPYEFNPDRFLPDEVAKRHPYAYIPFSAGPRNCIGSQFAMMSIKVLIATVLRKYIFYKDSQVDITNIKFRAEITIKTVDPITVKIKKRTSNLNKNNCH